MIKKTLSGLFMASIIFASCVKNSTKCNYSDSNVTAPDSEIQSLKDSLFSHNITDATLNPIGFYYKIDNAGSGNAVANLCTNISVSYKGTYFNGVSFDSTAANQSATFQLGQVIVGWQKGIPLVSKGGVISLYIPPTLAYGPNPVKDNAGNVLVPGNSYLVFKVHVEDIQ
ncbi:FKBP-type peptidylprolyl isomerase [Ginsengibacter hankyongi]|uniref:Peptidyl-prolyl cis-trans isomerase n=1 Tax=Ginsengibacter hankyongi TaxID=2607284 RepID=A0A5J5ID15_9BACT|nr:FKBP-type peptidyl-prolyl cis-trans isomerase [Ginsengibacter hankyongi]KAA9036293.1 FKBP-type peptidylprolyl isomerase [Ginsengibacter hankyongi]